MRTELALGATLDTLDRGELREELASASQEIYRQFSRGSKYIRFGPVATTVANSAFTIDGSSDKRLQPREGFAWMVRRITVWGLTAGPTPDVANLYRNVNALYPPVWQFNGNNFAYTFGKAELVLLPGEWLSLVSSGTIAAAGQVTISGDVEEITAEKLGATF